MSETLAVGGRRYRIHRAEAPERLPYSLRILLENLVRHDAPAEQRAAVTGRPPGGERTAIDLHPARIFLHDTNGVPVLADLAAMRDAMAALGGDPARVNPAIPAELVVDHSIIADVFGRPDALTRNAELEYARNAERYRFLRWGQASLRDFTVVPPGKGIMHQINVEHLARVVMRDGDPSYPLAYPDLCLGTDSHTTMVNGLGVLGWGIGGIEAEAAMLGQPVSMRVPDVIGVRLSGTPPAASTATDLVLTLTELLRGYGVVGKIVEFHGPGVTRLPVTDRVTISNMSPEFGSTAALFPVDAETVRYLRFTGRDEDHVALVEAYAREQGLWHAPEAPPRYTDDLELDLGTVVPSVAGPRRPQDRIPLGEVKAAFRARERPPVRTGPGDGTEISDGAVAIAAITSCTNTSNPSVMVAAGLLARNAVERGLRTKPWVKTTLSPGSRVVMDYYAQAGLTPYLERLGFNLTGFGCMTCIGASGPLVEEMSRAVAERDLDVAAVLSGNRNFDGRIQPEVRSNYLASPPLVVAYALAGTVDRDLTSEPLGTDPAGRPVYLRDVWPPAEEVRDVMERAIRPEMFARAYAGVLDGDERWRGLGAYGSPTFDWEPASTYVRRPTYLDGLTPEPARPRAISDARVLLALGDFITTDHISPAGAIPPDSAAGRYLTGLGVARRELNTYASRRGNHEVMVRGAFANVRLRNLLAPGTEGGFTPNLLDGGALTTVYAAARAYAEAGVETVVLAGEGYGAGSSRDWAAKGPALLGVRAVIAKSFERIHRSNLAGMGVLPLEFLPGEGIDELGLTGHERITIRGLGPLAEGRIPPTVTVTADGTGFQAVLRLETPREAAYYTHGGILPYVLRTLLNS